MTPRRSLEFVCPVHSRKCDFRPRRSATKFKANQWARYELYATIGFVGKKRCVDAVGSMYTVRATKLRIPSAAPNKPTATASVASVFPKP